MTNETTQHATLREAQLAVMQEVEYIQREKSAELGYAILTEQAAIATIRPAMVKHGILMYCSEAHYDHIGEFVTTKGSRMAHVVGRRRFTFEHVHSGEKSFLEVFCEASDTSDRASSKANTIAKKTAMREFFVIETGNDESAVVGQRGAPNEHLFKRAIAKINTAKTIDEASLFCAGLCDKQNDEGESLWTEEQIKELHKQHDKRAEWIVANAGKAAKTAADKAF